MNKDQIRKELNEFLDSASDETVKEFLRFMRKRRDRKFQNMVNFNNRLN